MTFGQWALRWLAVDGVLPAVTFAIPQVVAAIFPGDQTAAAATSFVLPASVAAWRAHHGESLMPTLNGGSKSWWRKLAFVLAIVALYALDMISCAIAFAPGRFDIAWQTPVKLVAVYLMLTAAALWPAGGFAKPARPETFALD